MKPFITLVTLGGLALASPALAMTPLMASMHAYANETHRIAATRADEPAKGAACENGEERDESGACPTIDDSASTRGFTLFSGSAAKKPVAPAKAPTPTPTATAAREVRPAMATETLKCGALCDLKVTFKTGSSDLTADSEAKLAQFAAGLRDPAAARRRYEIAGHTDASGSPEKNLALSQARAEAVKSFLVARGIPSSRLEAKGYGAEGLAIPNAPNDPRNRRIEARLLN
jgi:outer membrane protein OmpA-like peptidoglycan-associated protein